MGGAGAGTGAGWSPRACFSGPHLSQFLPGCVGVQSGASGDCPKGYAELGEAQAVCAQLAAQVLPAALVRTVVGPRRGV